MSQQKMGVGKTRGEVTSCLDFSEVGTGQLASRQKLGPHSNMAVPPELDQKRFTEAPFSTKSYLKLSRFKVTLQSNTVWNII